MDETLKDILTFAGMLVLYTVGIVRFLYTRASVTEVKELAREMREKVKELHEKDTRFITREEYHKDLNLIGMGKEGR